MVIGSVLYYVEGPLRVSTRHSLQLAKPGGWLKKKHQWIGFWEAGAAVPVTCFGCPTCAPGPA